MTTVEKLVIRNAEWIYRKARQYYQDINDAEDLAGETICKCLSQAHTFDGIRNFKPWVVAIMCNTYVTQYNRRKCVFFTGIPDDDMYPGMVFADQLVSVRGIMSIIRKLKKRSKSVECVMLYAQGFSYSEISRIMCITTGAVGSHISIGRKLLRNALEE